MRQGSCLIQRLTQWIKKSLIRSKIFIIARGLIIMGLSTFFANIFLTKEPQSPVANSIYDFKLKSLDGKEIDFSQYKGKKLLIVNTASKCGKPPQYEVLEKLHEQFREKII